jgi:hypothetical protein
LFFHGAVDEFVVFGVPLDNGLMPGRIDRMDILFWIIATCLDFVPDEKGRRAFKRGYYSKIVGVRKGGMITSLWSRQ